MAINKVAVRVKEQAKSRCDPYADRTLGLGNKVEGLGWANFLYPDMQYGIVWQDVREFLRQEFK